ncbi:MAG: RNA polymerase sigma-70 factor [Muribaculaceae bacterium]|nr:RNA polymerase sigma-70 factor [Muribaculaceae bacterium]
MIDKSEILTFKSGDEKSFEEIYRCYVGKTYNYIYKLSTNEELSKDITQNTFLQLWSSREKIDVNGNLDGYIFAIARNLLFHEIRSRNVQRRYEEVEKANNTEEYQIDIDEELSRKAIEHKILSLLVELPESRRKIFMMRWQQGMSNKEIAKELSISEKTVSTQIYRAVGFLKSKIGSVFIIGAIISASHF